MKVFYTTGGQDARGIGPLNLYGNLFPVFMVSCGIGTVVGVLVAQQNFMFGITYMFGIPGITYAVLKLFFNNKPPHYVEDLIHTYINPDVLTRLKEDAREREEIIENKTVTNPRPERYRYTDAWIWDKKIIFNELSPAGYISAGFDLQVPELYEADPIHLDRFADSLKLFLDSLNPEERIQIKFSIDNKYPELEEYRKVTEKSKRYLSRHIRTRIYNQLKRLEQSKQLKRKKCRLYVTKMIKENSSFLSFSPEKRLNQAEKIARSCDIIFNQKEEQLNTLYGTSVTRLSNKEIVEDFANVISPECADMQSDLFDYNKSVFTNLLSSSTKFHASEAQGYGFTYDGYFHNIIVMKSTPRECTAELLLRITDLPFVDYDVTVNIVPVDIEKQLKEDESHAEEIRGDLASGKRIRLREDLEKLEDRILSMQRGRDKYFKITYIVHVKAKSFEELMSNTEKIKNTILTMGGARYWEELGLPSAWKLYLTTIPGWTFSSYKDFWLHCSSSALARFMPLASSFTGMLSNNPEILMLSNKQEVIGIKLFIDNTPQLAAMFGKTRAGKSFNIQSFIVQAEPYFDYVAVVEEGNSFGMLVKCLGGESIIFREDSSQVINPFDLTGSCLTNSHIKFLGAFLNFMCTGKNIGDLDKNRRRIAIIENFCRTMYKKAVRNFLQENPDILEKAEITAFLVDKYTRERMSDGSTFLDGWVEVRDITAGDINNEEALRFIQNTIMNPDQDELAQFLKNPDNKELVNNVVLSFFRKEEYPQLSDFLKTLELSEEFNSNLETDSIVKEIHQMLLKWRNSMFDGVTNINRNSAIDHFELGMLGKESSDLKELIIMLINKVIRDNIIMRPRAQRKQIIFDECRRLFEVPGGMELVQEMFGQMAKFSAWTLFATQYYRSTFGKTNGGILENCSQLFVMLQSSRDDLKDVQHFFPEFSDVICENIMHYPMPAELPPDDKHSRFAYYQDSHPHAVCGTVRNYVPPELAYIASSTGSLYEERMAISKKYKSPEELIDFIIQNSKERKNNE